MNRKEPRDHKIGNAPAEMKDRFLTKPEMAQVLKISLRTLTAMMRRGEIDFIRLGKRLVRFRLEDVERRLSGNVNEG